MRLIMIYGEVLPDERFRCVLWFGKFNLSGGKSGKGKKKREIDPNACGSLIGLFRLLLLKDFCFARFLFFRRNWFSSISHQNDFLTTKTKSRRYCRIIASSNITKFHKILLIKCLRTGLWQRHNVSKFIYKTIIIRTHWHIYRTRGWPFHRTKAQTLIRKAELITRSLEYYELVLQCVIHRLNAANKVSRWY